MVQVVSPTEVQSKPLDIGDGNQYAVSWFIGSPDADRGHTVHMGEVLNPGGVIPAHFHDEHQFQLIASGSGRLGKAPVAPGTFHYVDAYTPYGPIEAGPDGLAFFTIRVNPSHLTENMPGARHLRAERSQRAGFTHALDLAKPEDTALEGPHPDGLAAFRRTFEAGKPVELHAPEMTGGQVAFVLTGELVVDDVSYRQWSCVSVPAGEVATGLAGDVALDMLILQFPERLGYVDR
jgi:hypothetical protein